MKLNRILPFARILLEKAVQPGEYRRRRNNGKWL